MTTEAPLHLYTLTGQERVKITQINPETQLLSPENVFCTTADIATLSGGGGGSTLNVIQGSDTVTAVTELLLAGDSVVLSSGESGEATLTINGAIAVTGASFSSPVTYLLNFAGDGVVLTEGPSNSVTATIAGAGLTAGPNIEIGGGSITATYAAGSNITITNGAAGEPGTIAFNPTGQAVDLYAYVPSIAGTLAANQTLWEINCARALSFGANLSGSYVQADVAATAAATLTLSNNGTVHGHAAFAIGATSATITATAFSTAAGDLLAWTAPSSSDATLAGVRITMTGTRA